MTETPLIAVNLDPAAPTTNYKQVEKGITVIFAPAMSDENRRGLSKRNYRRLVLNKAKKIGIEIPYETFMGKSVTDQFLFLRQYIPDGWQPMDIQPWYVEDKAVTTPIGKFSWPDVPEGVQLERDLTLYGESFSRDGKRIDPAQVNIESGQAYILDEAGAKVPVDMETRDAASFTLNAEMGTPYVGGGRVIPQGTHSETCKVCGGEGRRLGKMCPECNGIGTVRVEN